MNSNSYAPSIVTAATCSQSAKLNFTGLSIVASERYWNGYNVAKNPDFSCAYYPNSTTSWWFVCIFMLITYDCRKQLVGATMEENALQIWNTRTFEYFLFLTVDVTVLLDTMERIVKMRKHVME